MGIRLLLIDNYDSFTFNLVHAFESLGADVTVLRSDRHDVEECLALKPQAVVVGPGPGAPKDAGISCELIKAFAGKAPLLGVCLGHQCIGELFGAKVVQAPCGPRHGKTSAIRHEGRAIFSGMPLPFLATRYHSLVVDKTTLPACLCVLAWSPEGEIMGLQHKDYPLYGVQFHPESVLTEEGNRLFMNFFTSRQQ